MSARRIHENDRSVEVTYATDDEAIAAAMADLEPGGVIVLHTADCEQRDADETKCTCQSVRLVVGAQA